MSTRDEQDTRESLADLEHVHAAFDRQQKKLDEMQRTLDKQRAPFDQESVRLRKQLADKISVQHGNPLGDKRPGQSRGDNRKQNATTRKQKKKIMVTKAQYEKIVRRIKSPKPTLAPKPPKGVVPRNVDHDLKHLAEIKTKLDGAGKKLQHDFKKAHSQQAHKRK